MAAPYAALEVGGAITLPIVLFAGLLDGFNPCSFAGLLVFASLTFAAVGYVAGSPSPRARRRFVRNGSVYILAMFLTYFAMGVGFLGIASAVSQSHVVGKAAALVTVGLGLWTLRDALLPEARWRLELPPRWHGRVQKALRGTTVPAVAAAGFLVGLCTLPCSGGIYLGILALLSAQEVAPAVAYLLVYNAAFVTPLVLTLLVATRRGTFRWMARVRLRHGEAFRGVLGVVMIALGLFTLLLFL
jgi:cytochrome c biogenesis protein CcdA